MIEPLRPVAVSRTESTRLVRERVRHLNVDVY